MVYDNDNACHKDGVVLAGRGDGGMYLMSHRRCELCSPHSRASALGSRGHPSSECVWVGGWVYVVL